MEDQRIDELARGLARPVSRRTVLKTAVLLALGGAFGLRKARPAEAASYQCAVPCGIASKRVCCPRGESCCRDGCKDLKTDITNCGSCDTVCSGNHMATVTCGNGICNGSCAPGYGDCNGDKQADGCETPLTTLANCGSCGVSCAPAHATQ